MAAWISRHTGSIIKGATRARGRSTIFTLIPAVRRTIRRRFSSAESTISVLPFPKRSGHGCASWTTRSTTASGVRTTSGGRRTSRGFGTRMGKRSTFGATARRTGRRATSRATSARRPIAALWCVRLIRQIVVSIGWIGKILHSRRSHVGCISIRQLSRVGWRKFTCAWTSCGCSTVSEAGRSLPLKSRGRSCCATDICAAMQTCGRLPSFCARRGNFWRFCTSGFLPRASCCATRCGI